jgi:hypothetical protein
LNVKGERMSELVAVEEVLAASVPATIKGES